jgi:hypothetical protein
MENSKLAYIPLYPEHAGPPLAINAEPLDAQPADPPVLEGGTAYAWAMDGVPFSMRQARCWRIADAGGLPRQQVPTGAAST